MKQIYKQGELAKAAAAELMLCSSKEKNTALLSIACALEKYEQKIIDANAADMENARKAGKSEAFIDRLMLNSSRIKGIAEAVRDVISLEDPVGRVDKLEKRPNGLLIGRKAVPLGVIAIIYESRPNVTVDAAVLCLKSGNACILRSGKEAFNTSNALADVMRTALNETCLPVDSISLVQDISRDSVDDLLNMTKSIDVLIPRGGAGLINHVVQNSKVPVIETGIGNCHVYVEKTADLQMAAGIVFNAKCRRVSVCNAAETLLVDREIANEFLPAVKVLLDSKNVELRGCAETAGILGKCVKPVTEEDYYTEFLDYILAVKVVNGFDETAAHISEYGSGHSEAIITSDYNLSQRFLDEIDSAAVYVNASTAFTDGGEFGLGAEIGISTQKMHARGPMGLEQLTSSKFIIYGNGQVR